MAQTLPSSGVRSVATSHELRVAAALTRPSEEYRRPTPAEWEEFEGHFVKRKVSLGSCGRAYGTNCHHEHACLRCALLRPDPEPADRLREIITNLHARVTEAEQTTGSARSKG
jgi:hypothetical protein